MLVRLVLAARGFAWKRALTDRMLKKADLSRDKK